MCNKGCSLPVISIRCRNKVSVGKLRHRVAGLSFNAPVVEGRVRCEQCHGEVDRMPLMWQAKSLYMEWCLECHRNPGPNLRPVSEVTNMGWIMPDDHAQWAERVIKEKGIAPPETCSACHR